jgi:hypothetical protein
MQRAIEIGIYVDLSACVIGRTPTENGCTKVSGGKGKAQFFTVRRAYKRLISWDRNSVAQARKNLGTGS